MGNQVEVKVAVDNSTVGTGLAKVSQSIDNFKQHAEDSFKEVGAEFAAMFAVVAVIESIKGIGEEMDRVQKLAERFGESAETIQRVGEAAKLNGSDMEAAAKAMEKVNVNSIKAIDGNKELTDAFGALGLNAKDFVDLPMDEKLAKLADGYAGASSNAEKHNAVIQILGKSAGELIPTLEQGGDKLRELYANANVASDDTVASIAETTDRLEKMFDTLKTWGAEALGFIIHLVDDLAYAAAIAVAYVSNLSHGFKAAKEAAIEQIQAIKDYEKDQHDENEAKTTKSNHGDTAKGEAAKEAREEAAKKAADDEKELGKLQAENDKKHEEARVAHLTLLEREKDIKRQLADLDAADDYGHADQLTLLKNDNARLDLNKELDKVQSDIAKKHQADVKEAERLEKEKAKSVIDAKKEALKKSEDDLHKLEHQDHFSVDSLRQIGGGASGVNYRAIGNREEIYKQQLDAAKQSVELQKQMLKALEDANKPNAYSGTGNGGFLLS